MWILNEDIRYPGYFYICNAKYNVDYDERKGSGYRLAKWGSGDHEVGVVNGKYEEDQLWKFEPQGNNTYLIKNKAHQGAKLAKWDKDDTAWGTFGGDDITDDQLWMLTPRFEATLSGDVILHACNGGSTPIKRAVEYVVGITTEVGASVSTTVGMEKSLTYSAKITSRVQYLFEHGDFSEFDN